MDAYDPPAPTWLHIYKDLHYAFAGDDGERTNSYIGDFKEEERCLK